MKITFIILFLILVSCKAFMPKTDRCGSEILIGPFASVEELIEITNTSEYEKSRKIDLFILNSFIVSRDSLSILLKNHKNHKITSVQSVVSGLGGHLDGITPRHILIESCIE